SAQPNVQKQKEQNFCEEVEHSQQRKLRNAGAVPAAKKQCRSQHGNRNHVDIFRIKEKQKLDRAIFGMKAGNQFCFCFRQIKGHAIGLSDCSNQIENETKWLIKNIPLQTVPAGLLFDDVVNIQR